MRFEYCCDNCQFEDMPECKQCKACEQAGDHERPTSWVPKNFSVLIDMIASIKSAEEKTERAEVGMTAAEADEAIKYVMRLVFSTNDFEKDDCEENDPVNHPKHYCREGAMECFDEFRMIYGDVAAFYACLFNLHKYRYRAGDKNGQEDVEKSDWYSRKIKELKEDTGIELEHKTTF